jgi:hypothetical protein
VWLHNREDMVLPITVELQLRQEASRAPPSLFTDAHDCSQYSVRLSFRTDPIPYGEGTGVAGARGGAGQREGGTGGEIQLSTCSTVELDGDGQTGSGPGAERGAGGVRQALVFSVPAPALLACLSAAPGAAQEFARPKQTFRGCYSDLEAFLIAADRGHIVLSGSEVVRFKAYEALEGARVEQASVAHGQQTCREHLPELLHLKRGGDADGRGPLSSIAAIELGVASGHFSNKLLMSRHIAHLYSVP